MPVCLYMLVTAKQNLLAGGLLEEYAPSGSVSDVVAGSGDSSAPKTIELRTRDSTAAAMSDATVVNAIHV